MPIDEEAELARREEEWKCLSFDAGGQDGVVRTGISQAFWFDPTPVDGGAIRGFAPAKYDFDDGRGEAEVFWLDGLLRGGLRFPAYKKEGSRRAVTMLLSGPPGTGKSTLAAELCLRWAQRWPQGFHARYTTTEAPAPWLVDNATKIFGKSVNSLFDHQSLSESERGGSRGIYIRAVQPAQIQKKGGYANLVDYVDTLFFPRETRSDTAEVRPPLQDNVVVIDSLNLIPSRHLTQLAFLDRYNSLLEQGARLVVFVLDSHAGGPTQTAEFWEYQCDIHIRVGRTYPKDPTESYMLRTIEVVKARYQEHVLGPHQMKIYRTNEQKPDGAEPVRKKIARMVAAHPFRQQGGIFIYPSVHYMSSLYKRALPAQTGWVEAPMEGLKAILRRSEKEPGSFPRGRCTAFVGVRGGHKSHLGFMHVLSQVTKGDSAIIVSLRDDVGITRTTMLEIIAAWKRDRTWSQRREWADIMKRSRKDPNRKRLIEEQSGHPSDDPVFLTEPLLERLEMMYFPSGNITPEEFLHRIWLSIRRLKTRRDQPITLLFNSLDQLGPRFPLCAKEPVFIATLIQMLSSEGVTSLFVAASETGSTNEGYTQESIHGLDSIAELILEFKIQSLNQEANALVSQIGETYPLENAQPMSQKDYADKLLLYKLKLEGAANVVVRVVRHAGGRSAGSRAVLELVDPAHPLGGIVVSPGLRCFKI